MADINAFMKLIKAMESSGGKDTKHKRMTAGIHEGDAAVGAYGIMPKTAKEIAKRRIRDDRDTPSDDVVANVQEPSVEALLKENPELAREYAKDLAELVMKRTQGDPGLGMTAWHYGHNRSLDSLKDVAERNPEYLDKVDQRIYENKLMSKMPSLMDVLTKKQFKDKPVSKKK